MDELSKRWASGGKIKTNPRKRKRGKVHAVIDANGKVGEVLLEGVE